MSKINTAKAEGRIRTLLQSVDTARYLRDKEVDREIDIAHARSEALCALLFGYEIVIPAGAIADCPALHTLIPEVLADAQVARKRIRDFTKRNYNIFRLGLENQYRKHQFGSGYSAFVQDYLNANIGNTSWVTLEEIVYNNRKDAKTTAALLGKAYVNRDWKKIEKLGDKIANKYGDDQAKVNFEKYAGYSHLIYQYFEAHEDASSPVYTSYNYFSRPRKGLYHDGIKRILRNVENRDIAYQLKSAVNRAKKEIENKKALIAQRGTWYQCANIFEDHGSWEQMRIWLDSILYDRMRHAFGVDVPSYFTQEFDMKGEMVDLTLAFINNKDIVRHKKLYPEGKSPMPPIVEQVDWASFWDLVSEEKFQESIGWMHQRLFNILEMERHGIDELKRRYKVGTEAFHSAYMPIQEQKRKDLLEVIDHHLEFINGRSSRIKFQNQDGKVVARAEAPKTKLISPNLAVGEAIIFGTEMAKTAYATLPPDIGMLTVGAAAASSLFSYVTKEWISPKIIDLVSRKKDVLSMVLKNKLADAEIQRVNYWITE